MGLRHAVVTSVDRDDLADGGAGVFAATIRSIRALSPGTTIEVLTPDFQGDQAALRTVMDEVPEIFNHNVETSVASTDGCGRSRCSIAAWSCSARQAHRTAEPHQVGSHGRARRGDGRGQGLLDQMRAHDIEIITIGQYLRPSLKHHPLIRYWHPDEFAELKAYGMSLASSTSNRGRCPLKLSRARAGGRCPRRMSDWRCRCFAGPGSAR